MLIKVPKGSKAYESVVLCWRERLNSNPNATTHLDVCLKSDNTLAYEFEAGYVLAAAKVGIKLRVKYVD